MADKGSFTGVRSRPFSILFRLKGIFILALGCIVVFAFANYLEHDAEIYTFPEGYQGPVLVVYGQASGEPTNIEDGVQIFHIPPSGLLVTQAEKPKGVGDSFWYRDEHGNLTKKLVFNQNCAMPVSGDPVVVCVLAETLILNNQIPPRHSTFIVGQQSQQSTLSEGYFEWRRGILLNFIGK